MMRNSTAGLKTATAMKTTNAAALFLTISAISPAPAMKKQIVAASNLTNRPQLMSKEKAFASARPMNATALLNMPKLNNNRGAV